MQANRKNVDFRQYDPFRPLDARWIRVGQIVHGKIRQPRGLDDATKAAIAYLRRREQSACTGRRRKDPNDDTIAAALELHEVDGLRGAELEARVLANQPPEEIAARCGLTVGTITWYESLFFDCRPRLHAWGWVVSQVLGDRLRHGFGDGEMGLIWQATAYFGGSTILDAVIAATKACCRHGELPTVSACLAEGSNMPLAMKAVLASMVMPQLPELTSTFFATHLRLLELPLVESPAAEASRDRVAKDVIEAARTVLAGKPVPRPEFQPDKPQAARHPAQGSAAPEPRRDVKMGATSSSI